MHTTIVYVGLFLQAGTFTQLYFRLDYIPTEYQELLTSELCLNIFLSKTSSHNPFKELTGTTSSGKEARLEHPSCLPHLLVWRTLHLPIDPF